MDQALMLELAHGISRRLTIALDNPAAQSIELSRDEAVICLGLVNGVAELLSLAADPKSVPLPPEPNT